MSTRRVLHSLSLAAFGALLFAGTAAAQGQPGTIAGRVTDAASGQPIAAVQLNVVGTNLGAQTNAQGQYTIRGITPGQVTVRALRVGFSEARQPVTVTAGQTATADIQMRSAPITLSPVVTTATGEQRRVEVGNAIAQVQASEVVEQRAIANVGDLLANRAAGVQVLQGTQTGNGTRIRIRGTSSVSLTNNPIYVIDGVRVESSTGSSSLSVGGSTIARTADLNPEEIESIEVVRGPSAATLYGTDAANGVVVITTKKGIAGRPQWSYYTEQTAIQDRNDYPTAYRAWRTGTTSTTNSTPANFVQCFLSQVSQGTCQQDSVTTFNLFEDPETTPYGTGYRYQHGIQLRTGTDALRYFLSAEYESEDGVTKVPEFERRYLARNGLSLRPEEENPNGLRRFAARSNLNVNLPGNADLALGVGYVSQDIQLPMSDDSGVSGIGANVYGGLGYKYNTNAAGDTLFGWRSFTPRNIYRAYTNQSIERVTTSLNGNWRPQEWIAMRGNFGIDFTNRQESQLCRRGECPDVGSDLLGYAADNRTDFFTYTLDGAATGTYEFSPTIQSKTTVGVQFYRNTFARNGAFAAQLPPGAQTVSAGAVPSADETSSESRTLGSYIEEHLAFNDRLFLTGALRTDRNSAFGVNFGSAVYPKLAASWVLSDEPALHVPEFFDQLRLRTAYGASGVQPGTIDAIPYYVPTTARMESGDVPGVVFSTAGNPDLKPERSTEFELGLDATFWDSRINSELTYYNKQSRDALIAQVIPPSLGTSATSRLVNVGQVSNKGIELMLNAQLVQRSAFGWDLTLNGSSNDNELVSLGGLPEIINSSTVRQVEGYPLNGWWSRKILGWEDKNNDGILTYNADSSISEVKITGTTDIRYHGRSQPKVEAALTNGFDFLNRQFRVAAQFDYKGGHLMYNNSERIRCSARQNCRAIIDRTTPFEEQARAAVVGQTVAGFFEPADFIRWRELALIYTAPQRIANIARARNATVTLAARNLGLLWTRYDGVDPEAVFGATGDVPSSFQAAAPPTFFTFRLTLGF